jgi:hypothetical protein
MTVIAVGLLTHPASGADLRGLAEFVQPAYTSMNFAAVCMRDDPLFLTRATGPRGTAFDYAQHVKDEAIDGLSEADASAILKLAADSARTTAKDKLYELVRPGDNLGTVQAVMSWCEQEGMVLIRNFIRKHDSMHAEVEEFLRRAKQ